MDINEYLILIKRVYEETISDYKTDEDKNKFEKILLDILVKMGKTFNENPKIIFDFLCEDYMKSVYAISKLSPGLSTGLYDERENIIINTYNGKMSDIPNDEAINEETIFDASSMTKMFTSVFLLKEVEKGNIDLNKNFSDYSPLLSKIDVPIIDALKFGVNLRTDGRLDELGISKEERERRFKNTFVFERNTYIYSDIPYMLVPLLFGKTLEEATENYLNKIYKFYRDELGLLKTGYSQINMTGGSIDKKLVGNKFSYVKNGLYDPKANLFENLVGYVSGHAGMTTTITDIEKLFYHLSHNLLNEKSLKTLITTINPQEKVLLDKEKRPVLRNGREVKINHAMGVYINAGSLRLSDVPPGYSNMAFAAQGSTGTYSVFDIENGFNATHLPNIRSGLYSKILNTGVYTYGDDKDGLPQYYNATLVSGTGSIKDGQIIRPDGTFMPYVRATNNFKEECLETLLKLRIAKRILIRKAYIEYSGTELEEGIEKINDAFNTTNHKKSYCKIK